MKNQSLKYCSALFVLAFSLGLGQRNQAFGQCPTSIARLSGSVLNSSIQAYPGWPNGPAHFLTLVNDSSQPIPMGQYLTWCVDHNGDINADENYPPTTYYSGFLYPTCDANLLLELPSGHDNTVTSYALPSVRK